MIRLRVTWHHLYIGLACQNCFAHSFSVGFNGAFYRVFWFPEGSNKIEYDTLGS